MILTAGDLAGRQPGAWAGDDWHRSRYRRSAGTLMIALTVATAGLTGCGTHAEPDRPPGISAGTTSDTTGAAGATNGPGGQGGLDRQGEPAAAGGKAADPVRLRVPDIAVTAPVVPLGLDTAGRLAAPAGFAEVGWNRAGPEPGDDGVAVIAGHVDSKTGPAVFYRLGDLRPGAAVLVDRADGTTATFVVDRRAEYSKADFPDQQVYHSGDGAQLRLITCGGAFNHATGHYVDNVVVFAHLA